MNKREIILSLIDPNSSTPYIPAGFFLHFPKEFHRGQAAIDKHLEFFNYTGMDFVKIQYELSFPPEPQITKPEDWSKVPLYGEEFFLDQWRVAKGLVDAVGSDTLVIMTLYSPYMCAGQIADQHILNRHILEHPQQVMKGLEIITESLITFVNGCIQNGISGFYHSTQGGESHRFGGSSRFAECIKPFDLALMSHINESCEFNILHICDYHGGYEDLTPFLDYPGDIVNCSLKGVGCEWTSKGIAEMFDRPFMGGMDRHGILVHGSKSEIEIKAKEVIQNAPENFMLGADCTLPGDLNWENIRSAIHIAHQQRSS